MICYRKATSDDLEALWARSISENPGDDRYIRWRDSFITRNRSQKAATFAVIADSIPVGEVTLDFHASGYGNATSRSKLADGKNTAYVTALRIREEFEGKGYVSKLMQCMEAHAKKLGFSRLTIGVEAAETRNLGIYLHWGYNEFIMAEPDDGELVLFYAKTL